MKILTILSLLLFFGGCTKEDDNLIVDPCIENPSDCEDNPIEVLDVLWIQPVHPEDTASGSNRNIELSEQGIVSNIAGIQSKKLMLSAFDDGHQIFEWTGLHGSSFSEMSVHKVMNLAIVQYFANIASVNLQTGQLHKEYVLPHGSSANSQGQLIGDYYYFTRLNPDKTAAWLVRSHLNDFENWETIYTIFKDDVGGSQPNIQSYNLWTDPQTGDEILVFQHRMAFPNRVDVVAWNMTKGELLWHHDDIEPNGSSSAEQIFIHDNKAYFQGQNTVWCFNLADGEILWFDQYLNPIRSFAWGNFVYGDKENLIFIKADGDLLLAYDPDTGNKHYSKTGMGIKGAKLSYHDGILYYNSILEVSSNLIAVRALTGQILWSEKSNLNYHSKFDGPIAIDPERGVLYASDQYYLMAIKLYED